MYRCKTNTYLLLLQEYCANGSLPKGAPGEISLVPKDLGRTKNIMLYIIIYHTYYLKKLKDEKKTPLKAFKQTHLQNQAWILP